MKQLLASTKFRFIAQKKPNKRLNLLPSLVYYNEEHDGKIDVHMLVICFWSYEIGLRITRFITLDRWW